MEDTFNLIGHAVRDVLDTVALQWATVQQLIAQDTEADPSGGGLRINDEVLADDKRMLMLADVKDGAIKLSFGRKRHVLLKPKG